MISRRLLPSLVCVCLTSVLCLSQVVAPAQDEPAAAGVAVIQDRPAPQPPLSLSQLAAGVREYPARVLRSLILLSDHPLVLRQLADNPDLLEHPEQISPPVAGDVQAAIRQLQTIAPLVTLAVVHPEEIKMLREVYTEAPEGMEARILQLREAYRYEQLSGAADWQQALKSDPVVLGQYRELLTQFCRAQKEDFANFPMVSVTSREYYGACPPNEAVMYFALAHRDDHPQLWKQLETWWTEHSPSQADARALTTDPRTDAKPIPADTLAAAPFEARKQMWRADGGAAGDQSIGLAPVIMQPPADQPPAARFAFAVAENARLWSRRAPAARREAAPVVAQTPQEAPDQPPVPEESAIWQALVEESAAEDYAERRREIREEYYDRRYYRDRFYDRYYYSPYGYSGSYGYSIYSTHVFPYYAGYPYHSHVYYGLFPHATHHFGGGHHGSSIHARFRGGAFALGVHIGGLAGRGALETLGDDHRNREFRVGDVGIIGRRHDSSHYVYNGNQPTNARVGGTNAVRSTTPITRVPRATDGRGRARSGLAATPAGSAASPRTAHSTRSNSARTRGTHGNSIGAADYLRALRSGSSRRREVGRTNAAAATSGRIRPLGVRDLNSARNGRRNTTRSATVGSLRSRLPTVRSTPSTRSRINARTRAATGLTRGSRGVTRSPRSRLSVRRSFGRSPTNSSAARRRSANTARRTIRRPTAGRSNRSGFMRNTRSSGSRSSRTIGRTPSRSSTRSRRP